ncbi:hypothetical protein D9M69_506400 [compost metagenome]
MQTPIEGCADVLQGPAIAFEPQAGGRSLPVVLRLLHQRQATLGMPLPRPGQVGGLRKFFQGIAAGGIEQAVVNILVAHLHVQQGLGDQLGDRAEHLAGFDVFADNHRRCRLQGETAAKHTQSAQAGLFAGAE